MEILNSFLPPWHPLHLHCEILVHSCNPPGFFQRPLQKDSWTSRNDICKGQAG